MRQRHVVAMLLVVALALGASLWLAARTGDPVVEDSRAADGATSRAPTEIDRSAGVRAPARRRGGPGALVGSVRLFGEGTPVVGVDVTIASQGVVLDAVTRDDGSFAFAGLPNADDWTLTVASDALGEARLAGIVVLPRQTTDVGVVYLAPKFGVPGVVVDERGRPIDGVAIAVTELRPHQSFDMASMIRELPRPVTPAKETRSGADGRFSLTGLPPGTYLVYGKKPGFAASVATSVIVAPTATLPVRLAMEKGYRVAGRVVRTGAGSVAAIPVVALCMDDLASFFEIGLPKRVFAETDADGAFALDGLSAGNWWILAAPPGEAVAMGDSARVPRTTFVEIRLEGGASLAGRVTGVGDAPVAGAEVSYESGKTVAQALTDAEGRYDLRGLAVGTAMRFLVHADGYCAFGADTILDPARRAAAALTLKPGANTRDVRLVAGGTVRGAVVEDGARTPIPAATVTVLSGTSFLDVAPAATTDDAGRFEIAGVPVGASVLVVRKAGWCQAGTADVLARLEALKPYGPDVKPADTTDAGSGPGLVVAKQGDVVERTIAMSRGVLLRGRVLGPSGHPVAGACVTVKFVPGSGENFGRSLAEVAGGGGDPSRLTDAQGRFEIAVPVAAGTVRVVATAPGFLEDSEGDIEIGGATPPPDIELKLHAGGTIEGRVTDAAGAPIDGAAVSWRRTPQFVEDSMMQSLVDLAEASDDHGRTTTDAAGAYRLTLVNPYMGSITLDVRDGRHVSVRRDGLDLADLDEDDGMTLRVDVTLESGLAITGRVSRLDGTPPTNAWVEVDRDGLAGKERDPSGDESRTEPDGRFRVDALAAGRYRLIGHAQGASDSAPLVVDAGTDGVEIRLAAKLAIAGVVQFGDGRPAVGAVVTARRGFDEDATSKHESRTSDDGAFRIEGLDPGEYDVAASAGPAPTDTNFRGAGIGDVAAGEVDVTITVEPGLTISGEVLGPGGAPVASGFVWCTPASEPDAESRQPAATISAGRFEAHGLSPGTYVVSVDVRGLVAPARSAEAGAADVSFRLTKGDTIKGRVLLPDGKPAFLADVGIEDEGVAPARMSRSSVSTDDHGAFTIPGVVAGLHRITASLDDDDVHYAGEIRDVRVVEGRTVEGVEIRLTERK